MWGPFIPLTILTMGRERVIYVNISSMVKKSILNRKVNVRQYKNERIHVLYVLTF
jgi:hypothetical protein